MARPILVQIHYSPWSEKARWALDHHGVDYEKSTFVPMLSNAFVRARTKKLGGTLTVPVLLTLGEIVEGSFEIAEWAERHGTRGTPLFPAGTEPAISDWNEKCDSILAAGRALSIGRSKDDRAALLEGVPGPMRQFEGAAVFVAKRATAYFTRKYGLGAKPEAAWRDQMRAGLDELRRALAGDRDYLIDGFMYADIAMAVALQFVLPVDDRHLRLGPATRRVCTDQILSKEYGDLLEWRTRIYDEHR